jgi:predicted transposase/invertase (TIGR01784 family)
MQSRVDRLLAVFNQHYITANKYELDLPIDDIKAADDDFLVINRLNYALLDKDVRHALSSQAEYQKVLDREYQESEAKGRLEGFLKGQLEGEQKGKLEGKLEGMRETAKNLKLLGIPVATIMQATGLSAADIETL